MADVIGVGTIPVMLADLLVPNDALRVDEERPGDRDLAEFRVIFDPGVGRGGLQRRIRQEFELEVEPIAHLDEQRDGITCDREDGTIIVPPEVVLEFAEGL